MSRPIYGAGFLDLEPKFSRDFQNQVSNQLGTVGKKAGGVLAKGITTVAKIGIGAAVAAGATGIAIAGVAIKGGLERALNIEDAQLKMRALGHDTDTVKNIMSSALTAVRGTAFGLDAAATAASAALASGVKEGEELTRVLSLTGDAASFMGNDFERAGGIVNKVLASNRLSMREVNQLEIAGVGITHALAEQYGVTAGEMRKMVEQGKVDAASFLDAMESGFGGSAAILGEGTRAMLDNLRAAMNRWGAIVVGPLLPLIRNVIGGLTQAWDMAAEAIQPIMDRFAESDVFARLSTATERIPEIFANIAGRAGDLGARIRELWARLGELWQRFLESPIGQAIGAIRRFYQMMRNSQGPLKAFGATAKAVFQDLPYFIADMAKKIDWGKLFDRARDAVMKVVDGIVGWLTSGGIGQILNGILQARHRLFDVAIQLFGGLLDGLVQFLPVLVSYISTTLIPWITDTIRTQVPLLLATAIELFTSLIDAIVTVVPELLHTIASVLLPNVLETILDMAPKLLTSALTAFESLIDALVNILPGLIETLLSVVLPQLIVTIVRLAPQILQAAIRAFLALVDGLLEVLPDLIRTLLSDVLPILVRTIIEMAPELLMAMLEAALALAQGLVEAVPDILHAIFFDVIPSIYEALLDLGPVLWNAGVNAMQALWDGMLSMRGQLLDWVKNSVVDGIKSLWPFSPAKEGPFAGRGNPLYAGRNIVGLLTQGMRQATPGALAAAAGLTTGIADAMRSDIAAGIADAGRTLQGAQLGRFQVGQLDLGGDTFAAPVERLRPVMVSGNNLYGTPESLIDEVSKRVGLEVRFAT